MWSGSAQATAVDWTNGVRFENSLVIVAFTVLYYDYLLTLFDEVQYFWKSARISAVSVLFVIIRYLGLLGPVPFVLEYFGHLPENMPNVANLPSSICYCQPGYCVMLVCRTYALYERNKRILFLLIVIHVGGGIFCLISIVTNLSPAKTTIPLPFTFSGCDLSLTDQQGIHLALAWGAMLWFDTTIFVLTFVRALRMRRHLPGGLLEMMFRDGTIYYGIMVAANVTNTITFLITPSGSPMKGMSTTLTNVYVAANATSSYRRLFELSPERMECDEHASAIEADDLRRDADRGTHT
ncbi:hypothetical protein PYCCODRAFT_48078 [Trametes coccinea BRFM310]|uniref:DUF6533 domain-containing protein n=1 Tax=Trametes coccinea (strain BRFM310) TaxID=1353009 RepID=A0A1Y2J5N0_TRAC3|nr:hypothetical protein PYCCODRAFT_48078 [Trametes coccinea BRFM310]